LAFLATPHGLCAVAGPGLRGFPLTPAACSRGCRLTAFLIFGSPSERSRERWNRLSVIPPLVGFECRPPAGIPPMCPLPGAEAPFGSAQPSASLVPPSWFRTTSTAFSTSRSRVCCTPQPAKGSPRFAPADPRGARRRWSAGGAPRDAVHTLRRLPLASSRTASLRPLPSCRYRPARLVLRPGRSPHRPPPAEADDVHPSLHPRGIQRTPRGVPSALVEMNERLASV